ncbi:MAG: hypothetical protein JSV03_05730 [Planctomycetota bacterium]|nr:MAG: hypothetical protein JSV03_05730 [Planctomycetota bacterium]
MSVWIMVLLCNQATIANMPHETLSLTRNGEAVCQVVSVIDDKPEPLMRMAEKAITDTVKRWDGVKLPVLELGESSGKLPDKPAIVLATWRRLKKVVPEIETSNKTLLRVAFLDEQGFVCIPVTRGSITWMCVVSRSPRGVYNGAVYLRDFLIDGGPGNLKLELDTVVRTPQMPGRPVYLLTIWGEEDEYTADDYRSIFASLARDGATHVYFWLSGHFPSKKFPQTYKISNKNWDSTKDSGIGTLADQHRLIQDAHDLGIGFYLGGALGGWCGTYAITNREPGTMRTRSVAETGDDVSEWVLCPSSPRSRRTLIDYYKEMFDALPEADGLYIESADEYGECQCERCRVPVDKSGSRMFGQNQLSLIHEMMNEIWKDHPHARLAYTIGYSPHVNDPAYYEVIRQMSADPRVEWMEARNSWEFPGPGGDPLPATYFSPRVMRWEYIDLRPLEQVVRNTMRVASSGMYGYIMTFSPGFSSGSFYHDIPYPTDSLPYILTHFVYREGTWLPAQTVEEMKKRVQRRFFGKEAPATLSDDLWVLREILRESAGKKISVKNRESLSRIEKVVNQTRRGASLKTQAGLDLMSRAINDIRRFCIAEPVKKNQSK